MLCTSAVATSGLPEPCPFMDSAIASACSMPVTQPLSTSFHSTRILCGSLRDTVTGRVPDGG
jgi:hypothetical protein